MCLSPPDPATGEVTVSAEVLTPGESVTGNCAEAPVPALPPNDQSTRAVTDFDNGRQTLGRVTQVPVSVPINVCGNTVDVIALMNPDFGQGCKAESSEDISLPTASR